MREIKFRGKRVDNGEWVYGYYINQYGAHSIYLPDGADGIFDAYHVIPETVGQFTGLTDKNGVEIYEGDILDIGGSAIPVEYFDGGYHVVGNKAQGRSSLVPERSLKSKILGNIHDNPELLK